jgi:flagellin-like hook-associated protein FlgL
VRNNSLTAEFPDFTDPTVKGTENSAITTSSTIRDLMGDIDNNKGANINHFYLRGVKHDGTAFATDIKMNESNTVGELLKNIGDAYGNTLNTDVVNVNLNKFGQIVVKDKVKGSSKLDFNMTAAVDYNQADVGDAANISDTSVYGANAGKIDNLQYGETNFKSIINGTSQAANSNLFVKSFTQSPYDSTNTYAPVLKSAEFVMSRAVASGDTLSITVDNGDTTTTPYTQVFTTDAATTYNNLKTNIEAGGDYTVTVVNDTITLNITAQGAAKNVSINTNLANDNVSGTGVVTVGTTLANSVLADNIHSISYDRTQFTKSGSRLTSDVPQVLKLTNAFASPSTKLSEVADLSQNNSATLDGTTFKLVGKNISGVAYNVQIDLKNTLNGGSTFSLDNGTTNYSIFDMSSSPRAAVNADDMTYQQLMDVVNMVVTGQTPTTNTTAEYDSKIASSKGAGNTTLSYDGKITFEQLNTSNTNATISLYDSNSGKFGSTSDSSVISFNTNNALTIRDPKTDFFKSIHKMIQSVVDYKEYPDASTGDIRGVGMENAIQMMDDMFAHVNRSHSIVGAQSNTLTRSLERTNLLEISTMTLRSSTIDTDLAEASLNLTQLTLNYQAMLSTVGKVSKLSLVNYL